MLSTQLKNQIRTLWDAFWSGGVANPLTAIEQITYLVFLKRLEDLDNERESNNRTFGKPYNSIFDFSANEENNVLDGDKYRWSYIKQLDSNERFDHMRKFVFDWLKDFESDNEGRMRDAVFLIPNANLLTKAITILDELFIPDRNQDTLGDIYEELLNEIASAGKNGQFRTPRHIIRIMCELVDVKFGDKVCDPACGTGGFLVNAYQHILQKNTSSDILKFKSDGTPINCIGDLLTSDEHHELRQNHLYGFDFDRTMVRLGWMNMIQHGLENPKLNYSDSLGSKFNIRISKGGDLHETFDVVLANPPFTGNIDKNDIGETLQSLGTNKTELLFIDLIIQLLKPGGRAAIIVPEGVLFGSTKAHMMLRKKIINNTKIQAIISLPAGVFQPYTGVKTSILVFTKNDKTDEIWFYEVSKDGQTLNAKRETESENNDLWDMQLKFKLQNQQEIPDFLRAQNNIWQTWGSFSEEDRSYNYLQPVFSKAEEFDDIGTSHFISEIGSFENIRLNQTKSWFAKKNQYSENKFDISASTYRPIQIDVPKQLDTMKLISELYDIENKIQENLDTLVSMINGNDK